MISNDMFLTEDFNDKVYTKIDITYVHDVTFSPIVKRHYLELKGKLDVSDNGFLNWKNRYSNLKIFENIC